MAQTAMLTLDVEDWEHANFTQLAGHESEVRSLVSSRNYRMESNTDRWIEILGARSVTSTCFVLGEFARRFPDAVKRLASHGHEIACHGDTHDLVYQMSQSQFGEWLRRAHGTLGDITGAAPQGFRAPSWSVDRRTPWLTEELAKLGFIYDSSIFPVKTPLFGVADSPLKVYSENGIVRVPATVLTFLGMRFPFASGAFFRLSPRFLLKYGLNREGRKGHPIMIVLHPRELDPAHPKLPLRGWEKQVHYARLQTTVPKLEFLLPEFKWITALEYVRLDLSRRP